MVGASALLVAGAARAEAGLRPADRIELRPPSVAIEELEPVELARIIPIPPLPEQRLSDHLFWHHFADDLRGPIELRLPELGPDGLDLEIRSGRFLFKVGAEMVAGRTSVVFTQRLDCDTRDTYFWVRLQLDVTGTLSVFAESFQAAGSILGVDPTEAIQRYVWDGYQLQLGARFAPSGRLSFEGGPVFYALSARQQPSGVGFRVGLRFEF